MTERERFEEYAREVFDLDMDGDYYEDMETHIGWEAWKACAEEKDNGDFVHKFALRARNSENEFKVTVDVLWRGKGLEKGMILCRNEPTEMVKVILEKDKEIAHKQERIRGLLKAFHNAKDRVLEQDTHIKELESQVQRLLEELGHKEIP